MKELIKNYAYEFIWDNIEIFKHIDIFKEETISQQACIKKIKKTSCDYEIIFFNNDIWRIVPATKYSKGYRCNISLIDRDIEKSIISDIILPMTISTPYSAYNYY